MDVREKVIQEIAILQDVAVKRVETGKEQMGGANEMDKYIYFEVIEEKPKTKVWAIFDKTCLSQQGIIKWYGSWRQYCFFPEVETVWSTGCLQDVIDFIEKEKRTRQALRKDNAEVKSKNEL